MCHRQKYKMSIPYRVRRGLQRALITLSVLALLALFLLAAWLLWLSRYVIYTEDGARLDFNLSPQLSEGMLAVPPSTEASVHISYGDSNELITSNQVLQQLSGYTISAEMLTENLSAVQAAVLQLPAGTPVLLDVKNVRGEFYYDSLLGPAPAKVNIPEIAQIIQSLKSNGCYLIARFPAFRDYHFIMEDQTTRVPYGLPKAGGNGSLWPDKSIPNAQHYWLNPASTGALNYVVQIVTELRNLGFHEVVFSDFRFPNTDKIRFDGDKAATLNEAAQTLMQACTTDTFAVSFAGSTIALPQGRCRLYFENTPAADIPNLAAQLALENPNAQLVFLTDLMDTRYDAYSVLRPLAIAAD